MGRKTIEETENMKSVYTYLTNYITENMSSPSIRDICDATGLRSTSSVYSILGKLEMLNKIERVGCRNCNVKNIRLVGYKVVREGREKINE